jgi:hypothetical protein
MSSPPLSLGLPYTLEPIPSFTGYGGELMQDGDPTTYWCTPGTPTFPFVMTLTLLTPARVSAIEVNAAIPGYDDLGPREISVEALDLDGTVIGVSQGHVVENAITRIPVAATREAARLRITITDFYGGAYLGVSELSVLP